MTDKAITPVHQWTHNGTEVFVVRFVNKDGKSAAYRLINGVKVAAEPFQHPMVVGETVTAEDWNSDPVCGGGIHAWPWGIGLGDGKECEWDALWQVYAVKPEDLVLVENKIKFRTGVLKFMGHWADATNFVLPGQMAWVFHSSRGSASNSGYSGSASNSGYSGSASNSGDRGSASTTHNGTAAIVTGLCGKAKAAPFGCIALAWWNSKENRTEMRCGLVGDGQPLKSDVWYKLDDDGNFVEAQ